MGTMLEIDAPPSHYFDVYDDGLYIEVRIKGLGVMCPLSQSARFRTEERFNIFKGCQCIPVFVLEFEGCRVEVENENNCRMHKFVCLSLEEAWMLDLIEPGVGYYR